MQSDDREKKPHTVITKNCDKVMVPNFFVDLPSEMSRSRISHANIVGFSRLYCSILDTTAGVATFGLEPPIKPGGRSVPANEREKNMSNPVDNCK